VSFWLYGQTKCFVSAGRSWLFGIASIPLVLALCVAVTRITGE
jgi:hypothetical protein